MVDISKARAPAPIEDRRNEFSEYQHLLMALGIPPIDNTDNARLGMEPGHFLTEPNGNPLGEETPPLSPLGVQAGVEQLAALLDPTLLTHRESLASVKLPKFEKVEPR